MVADPFTPGMPAIRNFVGRKAEIETFKNAIEELNKPQTLIVLGNTGVGKTSLLKQFETIAEQNSCISVFIGRGYANAEDLFIYMENKIRKTVSKLPERIKNTLKDAINGLSLSASVGGFGGGISKEVSKQKHTGLQFLDDMEQLFSKIKDSGLQLVLIIDQVEWLLNNPEQINALVALADRIHESDAKVLYAISFQSEKLPKLFVNYKSFDRAFSDIRMEVLPFNENKARDAILMPLEGTPIQFDDRVVKQITVDTKQDPYEIQLFCSTLFSYKPEGVVMIDEYTLIAKKLLEDLHSMDWKKIEPGAEMDIIIALSSFGSMGKARLVDETGLEMERLEKKLSALLGKKLVVVENEIYSIYHDRFRKFVMNTVGDREREAVHYKNMFEMIMSMLEKGDFNATYELTKLFIKKGIDICSESEKERLTKKIIEFLNNDDTSVRILATVLLGEIGSDEALEPLINALKDKDWRVQRNVANALGKIGNKLAVGPLIDILSGEDEYIDARCGAAIAIGDVGDKTAQEPLIKILQTLDEKVEVRKSVAEALRMTDGTVVVKVLIEILQDKDEEAELRSTVARELGHISDQMAVKYLIEILQDKDENSGVRRSVTLALGEMGAAEAVMPLVDALQDGDTKISYYAISALGKIGDRAAVPYLIEFLGDDDPEMRQNVALNLGKLRDKQAVMPLIKSLKDKNSGVRYNSALALGEIGDKTALLALKEALKDDKWTSFGKKVSDGAREATLKIIL